MNNLSLQTSRTGKYYIGFIKMLPFINSFSFFKNVSSDDFIVQNIISVQNFLKNRTSLPEIAFEIKVFKQGEMITIETPVETKRKDYNQINVLPDFQLKLIQYKKPENQKQNDELICFENFRSNFKKKFDLNINSTNKNFKFVIIAYEDLKFFPSDNISDDSFLTIDPQNLLKFKVIKNQDEKQVIIYETNEHNEVEKEIALLKIF